MNFHLGCQTITWGEGQRERFPSVFAEVAAAGFEGVEIGFRHLQSVPPARLRELLEQNGLVLVASHIGGSLEDVDQADRERSLLDETLEYLDQAGCHTLMYSGLRYENEDQLRRDLDRLNRAAALCQSRGVRLLYHNHDWEFAEGARAITALIQGGSPDLGFCPDVGWVFQGGADVLAFLDAVRTRIGAIHFKDFAPAGASNPFVTLGEGLVPFPAVADWLIRNRPGLWVIAEQDRADVPPDQAAQANGRYLRDVLAGENA